MARRKPPSPGRPEAPSPAAGDLLVNNLSVQDARVMLRMEGGEITPAALAMRVVSLAVVQGPVAWALATGGATLWHLLLPMLGQYFGCLVAIPLAYAWWRPEGLRKEAVGSVRLLVGLAAAFAITTYVRGHQADITWPDQAAADARAMVAWVVDYKMHWPLLAAFVMSALDTRWRVQMLIEHGPPYLGVSLGCAMRFLVVLLGAFLLPFVAANWDNAPWIVWGVVVLAEGLALAMHWDLQKRLRKLDAAPPTATFKPKPKKDSHPLDL